MAYDIRCPVCNAEIKCRATDMVGFCTMCPWDSSWPVHRAANARAAHRQRQRDNNNHGRSIGSGAIQATESEVINKDHEIEKLKYHVEYLEAGIRCVIRTIEHDYSEDAVSDAETLLRGILAGKVGVTT